MVEQFAQAPNGEQATDDAAKRGRSSIVFPYGDLNTALEVPRAIHSNAGNQCTIEQLAAYLGHKDIDSGAFQLKVATARIFGLIQTLRKLVTVTPLGAEVVDPQRERDARWKAFLHVPLYRAIFDKYNGRLLPPDVGLEREIENLGVSPKQTGKARQAFQRSADQAGFFARGRDRLVQPAGGATAVAEPETAELPEDERDGGSGSGGGGGAGAGGGGKPPTRQYHPFIEGLLATLPEPGNDWSGPEQDQWLQTAKNIFAMIYKNPQQKRPPSNNNND